MSPQDPWEWNVEKVSLELARITNDHTVGELAQMHRISGKCLLTAMTLRNLKEEVGIIPLGTRVEIMWEVRLWRRKSRGYDEYVDREDKQRKKDKLKDLVWQHELEQEFRQIGGKLRGRSLSPLPDLHLM